MAKTTVLFDLGGTLIEYYSAGEFGPILEAAIQAVQRSLQDQGCTTDVWDVVWQRALEENYESSDYRVRPLEERLPRILALNEASKARISVQALCRTFMHPIFNLARVYGDTIPALEQLRLDGFKIAIISNTPWGSPAGLWHEELARQGIAPLVDEMLFCRDAGWRKPAPQILELASHRLAVPTAECVLIGDDPRWDVAGAQEVGMDVVLLDRINAYPSCTVPRLQQLKELPALLHDQEW